MLNFYAVKEGHTTGVFISWAECQKAISGYSNADFKKFSTKEEAEAYISGRDIYLEIVENDIRNGYVVAFCDGAFDSSRNRYSYSACIIDEQLVEHNVCGSAKNEKYISSANIIGEILGAINAMDWAVSNGYEKLKLYHDYEGLSKWVSGEWKAKSSAAQMYLAIYSDKYADLLYVDFEKVKGHSNNKYNDKADELAKRALADNARVPISGDNWYSIPYFDKSNLEEVLASLIEDYPEITLTESCGTNRIGYRLKLNQSRLSVTLYQSGNRKLLAQGADSFLFQALITYVNELVGIEAEQVLATAYRTSINIRKIDKELGKITSTFPSDYPNSIRRLIRQAVINLNYFIESEDYSQYVFPAFRALEGHMKYLFAKAKVDITTFNCFNKELNGLYCLSPKTISDPEIRAELERCYNYYNPTRHTLFHFGDIIGATDTTRTIDTKEEADEHIKKCLSYIIRRME